MRIPRTVKVGPHVYRVIRKSKEQMPDNLGWCDFTELSIWLLRGMCLSKTREILVHELTHAACYPTFCGEEKFLDEEFVTAVAPVWLNILRENPKLVEYLTLDKPRPQRNRKPSQLPVLPEPSEECNNSVGSE
jgi:hypothetical protein